MIEFYKEHPLCISGALGDKAAVASGLLSEVISVAMNLGCFDRGSTQVLGRLGRLAANGSSQGSATMKRSPSFQSPMLAL